MSTHDGDPEVVNNEKLSRFEVVLDGRHAFTQYGITGDGIVFSHTEVPRELEGRGLGSLIVRTALDHARAAGRKVIPFCPFVAGYIQRHAEYQDLVEPNHRWLIERG
jgi:uncharacterized protein